MAEEETKEEVQQEKPKGMQKVIIIIASIVVVILLIIVGLVAFLLSDDKKNNQQNVAQQTNSGDADIADIQIHKTYLQVGEIYEMPLLTVNLISRKGKSYLRAKLDLEMDNSALAGELTIKKNILTDIVINILTSKTVEDLSSIKGKSRVKQEIIATINKSLLDGRIKNIFFTEFIIQ